MHVTRRGLLAALACTLVAWPLAPRAQQVKAMPVVGVIAVDIQGRVERLREGLRDAGYLEGRNIRLEVRAVDDRYASLPAAVDELVRLKVDVLFASGNTAAVAASKATSTIPIVMVAAVDPVKEKLAISLSRPGGNVTGLTTIGQEMAPKRLELMKQAVPGLGRVGILWNPNSRGSSNSLVHTQEAARALKLELQLVEARSPADFDRAFETLAKSRTHVFVVMNASMFDANWKQLLESATAHRLGGFHIAAHWADGGGLISYGPDPYALNRRAAVYIDKILKGAKPGDLPIEQPTKFDLVVNLRTAKSLGMVIPQTLLVRADRVIE